MTFGDYVTNCNKRLLRDHHRSATAERIGQAYFNELSLVRPDLADTIQGTYLDPFHNDAILGEFLANVSARWGYDSEPVTLRLVKSA